MYQIYIRYMCDKLKPADMVHRCESDSVIYCITDQLKGDGGPLCVFRPHQGPERVQSPGSGLNKHTLLFVIQNLVFNITAARSRETSGCSGEGLFSDAAEAPYQLIRFQCVVAAKQQ